jgi:hypothetical protein
MPSLLPHHDFHRKVRAPAATASRRGVAVAVAASCLGSSFDLFDLFILLYVAPVVGRLFFPSDSPMLSLAAVYAAFAVRMVARLARRCEAR